MDGRAFFIIDRVKDSASTSRIEACDLQGQPIEGCFYFPEVQVIVDKGMYKIDQVLRRQTIRGKDMSLVSWVGYGPQFNQWIPTSDIKNYS